MIKAIVVNSNNKSRLEKFNSRLYQAIAQADQSDLTSGVFSIIDHPTEQKSALIYDTNYRLNVATKDSRGREYPKVEKKLTELSEQFHKLSERGALKVKIRSNSKFNLEAIFPDPLPEDWEILSAEDLMRNKWFEDESQRNGQKTRN